MRYEMPFVVRNEASLRNSPPLSEYKVRIRRLNHLSTSALKRMKTFPVVDLFLRGYN